LRQQLTKNERAPRQTKPPAGPGVCPRRTSTQKNVSELTILPMEEVLTQLNSSLWSLAEKAKISDKLNGDNITVITSSENEAKPEDPTSYVLNHIIPRKYRSYEWKDGDVLKTSAGNELVVSQFEDAFGSVKPTLTAFHWIPLLITATTESCTLSTSVLSNDLREKLSSNSSFTVFAPSDKALKSLSSSLLKEIKEGTGCASDFASSHIVNGSFCSHDLHDRLLKSLTGSELEARIQTKGNERVLHIGRAKVTVSDIFAKNGVIHIIDDVVFNDELLSWREHLEVHNRKLKEALEDVVTNSSEKLTIFVPPADNSTITPEFAKNHVMVGQLLEDLRRPSTMTTQANSTIFTGYSRKVPPIWVRISMQPRERLRGQVGCSRIIEDSVKGCRAILQFIE
ncbi:fasciclin domain protein, partial [Cooperia oncophora]